MNNRHIIKKIASYSLVFFSLISLSYATTQPKFTIIPTSATSAVIGATGSATIQYVVTNMTKVTRTLTMVPIAGVSQITTGTGACSTTFTLANHQSCTLTLQISAATMPTDQIVAPVEVCKIKDTDNSPDPFLCSQTSQNNGLHITKLPLAKLSVTPTILQLKTDGLSKSITITNLSTTSPVYNVSANLTGTLLEGNVTQDASACTTLNPGQSCSILFTPGSTVVSLTTYTIQGTNAESISAKMRITSSFAQLSLTPQTLTLTANGSALPMVVANLSDDVIVFNVTANLSGTQLSPTVTYTGCTGPLLPLDTCELLFSPGSTGGISGSFPVQGSNSFQTPGTIIVNAQTTTTTISLNPDTLVLEVSGSSGTITITNDPGSNLNATAIQADLSGFPVNSITQTRTASCDDLAPGADCVITFTPGTASSEGTKTVPIAGSNTNTVTAYITVNPPADSISITGDSSLILKADGTSTGTITIQNLSTDTLNNIQPYLTETALNGAVTWTTSNNCVSLAPSAACTITFKAGIETLFTTSFPIYGFINGTTTQTNAVTASIRLRPYLLYYGRSYYNDSQSGSYVRCSMDAGGELSNCQSQTTAGAFGVAVNPNTQVIYLTYYKPDIGSAFSYGISCPLNSDKSINLNTFDCVYPEGFTDDTTVGIAFDASTGIAYMTWNTGPAVDSPTDILGCATNSSGYYNGTCSVEAGVLNGGQGLSLGNSTYKTLFGSNMNDSNIAQCTIASDSLSCSNVTMTSSYIDGAGIAINSSNSVAYIVRQDTSRIIQCPISGGVIGLCLETFPTDESGNNLALDLSGPITLYSDRGIAYISDTTRGIYLCDINSTTAALVNCRQQVATSDLSVSGPIHGLAIFPPVA